jgi:formate-dependent nitrite reductase membrane component NrfD
MGALFLDLAHKQYVFRFYLTFRPLSPMSWGAWILLAIYPATVLLGLLGLSKAELEAVLRWPPVRTFRLGGLIGLSSDLAKRYEQGLLWANLVLGVGLGAYTGLLIGTLASRPAWNSIMLAPLFLVSGISTGAALMMLFPMTEEEKHALRTYDVAAILGELVLLGLFLLSLAASGGETGREAAWLFLGGPFTTAFWTLVIFGGLLTPLVLEMLEAKRHLRATLMAPVLILVGGLSLRWVLLLAGQA